jgi:membrane protease YdiL (CAAX protease family)
MLFAVKNRLWPTLLVLALFVAGSLALKHALGLVWSLGFRPELCWPLLLGIATLVLSDGGLHELFTVLLGDWYRSRYRDLVEYFRPQRTVEILAGGLLAGGEELVFRGVVLDALRSLVDWPSAAAVLVSALMFGALHVLPQRRLWPFALWAVWEGVLLGAVYVLSGSLLVCLVLHFLHDVGGFGLFAYQRRTGLLVRR